MIDPKPFNLHRLRIAFRAAASETVAAVIGAVIVTEADTVKEGREVIQVQRGEA